MRNLTLPVLGLALALTGAARAETITADFGGVDPGRIVSVTLNNNSVSGISAGYFNWINVQPTTSSFAPSFQSFCIDLGTSVASSTSFTTQALTPRYDATTSARLREFWGENFASVGSDANQAAAFQLGLWEIVHETSGGSLDLDGGSFKADAAPDSVIGSAKAMLGNVDGQGTFEDNLIVLDSASSQDQILRHGNGNIVPVPPAVILGGMGLVSLVGYGVRRRLKRGSKE